MLCTSHIMTREKRLTWGTRQGCSFGAEQPALQGLLQGTQEAKVLNRQTVSSMLQLAASSSVMYHSWF